MSHYEATKSGGRSTARLLVVNVDPEDRYTLSEALQADGYEIVFCDSLDARDPRLFDDRSCDAWIIELKHPVETCFDLVATIRSNCPLVEVVILSRLTEEELWIESMQRGAYDFLAKPWAGKSCREL
jgi:DNA-binding response OmpR family regulator